MNMVQPDHHVSLPDDQAPPIRLLQGEAFSGRCHIGKVKQALLTEWPSSQQALLSHSIGSVSQAPQQPCLFAFRGSAHSQTKPLSSSGRDTSRWRVRSRAELAGVEQPVNGTNLVPVDVSPPRYWSEVTVRFPVKDPSHRRDGHRRQFHGAAHRQPLLAQYRFGYTTPRGALAWGRPAAPVLLRVSKGLEWDLWSGASGHDIS
ncbi:unnamed protein product [Pleuronectes platessa]|uniref:Uncharacterized protein n=1 Tax=Pleuronectes platessa TaxID=8262 RepID=A0A9N7UGF6_PLEPL|nr:unnamed protein product [Pleuronectes platessa]